MSTRLTNKNIPMVDSQALRLVHGTAQVHELTACYLSKLLKDKGYDSVTPSVLSFLSTLECGINFGSEIARNLGVSRQMIAKTVKQFCRLGYLEQVDGVGKQKQILFTERGEQLMSDARQFLADIDKVLINRLGKKSLEAAVESLEDIQELMVQLNNKDSEVVRDIVKNRLLSEHC